MELLAPAGGFEQLEAAIAFGADAVYLAADRFGMRARAKNFTLDDLPRAVAFAHDHGVSVHLACNTTIMEDDIDGLPSFLEQVDAACVDALIIGDIGAFVLAREHAPRCELHVSTQANVANSAAADMWYELGARRIVCAREMTLEDIAHMRQTVPSDLEIEVFAHGAQCMAVSGRCLISSYLTGRSANQGNCTQPCRWGYALEEEKRPGRFFPIEEDGNHNTFIMNAKDLNMIGHLDALAKAGVDSIKIEGRNKKAFYVATVVGAYRRALDALDEGAFSPSLIADLQEELNSVSHRPYSTGFFFGHPEQADDYDGYEQSSIHIADVLGCEPYDGRYRVYAKCRNRFEEGAVLEALMPRGAVNEVKVEGLMWQPVNAIGEALELEPVSVANRATDTYAFTSSIPIPEGSYLRVRQSRRSARSL